MDIKTASRRWEVSVGVLLALGLFWGSAGVCAGVDSPAPPPAPLKLIFIHHSCGENWLADEDGGLGIALRENGYFVSDVNYGWGSPCAACEDCWGAIGDCTDILHWDDWFSGPGSGVHLQALSTEFVQHAAYTRDLDPDPSRENEIILFKSCYPNSNLGGRPGDPPGTAEGLTVGSAKSIYNRILECFATRPDKLFVAITAPPVAPVDRWEDPANARAFNDWLVRDWLADYPHGNVAVFDFYNVLTSNGGDPFTSDVDREAGNHHRWWNGAVQHLQTVDSDLAAYPSGDSHPTTAGNRKATAEFVPLLNVFTRRWRGAVDPNVDAIPPAAATTAPSAPPEQPGPAAAPASTAVEPTDGLELLQPSDLRYLGAFRLPPDPEGMGWEWGGAALAYSPDGDPGGSDDGFPGSLFGTGHDWTQHVSEIAIPVPVISPGKDVKGLPTAATLQGFADVRQGLFPEMELPRAGLAYLPAPVDQTAGKLAFCWAPHMGDETANLTHGGCELDLSDPRPVGPWRVGAWPEAVTADYLFSVPPSWARANAPGMTLATGRYRDGGQGAQGPSLFALGPWNGENPPPPGHVLPAVPLVLYDDVTTPNAVTLEGYHHADEWSGGAWLTAGEKAAVVFVGTKGIGACWYGCADGTVWPEAPPYPAECEDRGWWSTGFEGRILFYRPDDLAAVARGELPPSAPQPYAWLNLDPVLFHVTFGQQKGHLGAAAFDRDRGLLYVMEPLVDEDRPIVHVWCIALPSEG